jgi:hypothetical protein
VVGLEESAFSPDEDVVAAIAHTAGNLEEKVEVVRLDELRHLYQQAALRKLVDASPPPAATDRDEDVVEIRRVAAEAIKIDGSFDDWGKAGIGTLRLTRALFGSGEGASEQSAAGAEARIAYDDKYLYLAVEVRDKSLCVDDYNLTGGDSVVLLLDTRTERFREPEMTEGFYKLHLIPRAGLLEKPTAVFGYPTFDLDLVSNNRHGIEEEVESKVSLDGYALEAAIPLMNFPYLKWKPGATFGFGVSVNDVDSAGDAARFSSNGKDAMDNPVLLSRAVLR